MEPLALEPVLVHFAHGRRIFINANMTKEFSNVQTAKTQAIAKMVKEMGTHDSALEVACMNRCFFFVCV